MPLMPENGWVKNAATVSPQGILEGLGRLQEYIIESIPGSVYLYDLVNQYTLCSSRSLATMLGYTDEIYAMGIMGFAELIHPDDLESVADHYQRFTSLSDTKVIAIEYRMQRADGTWCWLRSQETLLAQSDESSARVLGVVQDITAFKREEELLETFSHLVEEFQDMVLVTDCRGVITYVNRAFEQMSGYSATEVIGKTPALLKSGQHDTAFYRQLWNTLHSGQVFRSEFVNRKKNGELFYIKARIKPIIDKQRRITHLILIGKDITLQREVAEMLSSFLANSVHELK